jgi:hypothetical protein
MTKQEIEVKLRYVMMVLGDCQRAQCVVDSPELWEKVCDARKQLWSVIEEET